jgi:hypothetical protein
MNKKEREILLKMIDIYKLKIQLIKESINVAQKKLKG